MQVKEKLLKWISGAVLVATAGGALAACYVESRPRHHYHRPREVVIIKR